MTTTDTQFDDLRAALKRAVDADLLSARIVIAVLGEARARADALDAATDQPASRRVVNAA